jgi:hypothetical protein
MTSRSAYLRNKQTHDQREFPYERPKSAPEGSNTAWIADYRERLVIGDVLVLAHGLGAELGEDRLRQLAKMQIVHMTAVRVKPNGQVAGLGETSVFSHYAFEIVG